MLIYKKCPVIKQYVEAVSVSPFKRLPNGDWIQWWFCTVCELTHEEITEEQELQING